MYNSNHYLISSKDKKVPSFIPSPFADMSHRQDAVILSSILESSHLYKSFSYFVTNLTLQTLLPYFLLLKDIVFFLYTSSGSVILL